MYDNQRDSNIAELRYRQRVDVDGHAVELDIVDVSRQDAFSRLNCDGVVVLYSIVDRESFAAARLALDAMADADVDAPCLLLANKVDLEHLRKVIGVEYV